MEAFVSYSLAILAGLLAIPVAVFFLEIVAAIALPQREPSVNGGVRGRIAALVPAHNESAGLLPTIADIHMQLREGDRLLVVADNCEDDTAAVAAAAGAEVVERYDPTKRGKGYALDRGLRYLSTAPPDIVIIIDADCRLADDCIDRLADACALTGRPAQALDLMISPEGSPVDYRVAEFAWRVKNLVRPLGLRALNLPCQLMGTGMAFPWNVISSADIASGLIVEDLKLGLDLALVGRPALFCPSARVTSRFPSSLTGAEKQRTRWEQGHIGMILTVVPRLISTAFARGNLTLLALTFDLVIPPLSLLGMLVVGMLAVASLAVLGGLSPGALIISTASFLGFTAAAFLSWLKFGRDVLPPRAILLIAFYVFGKLRLYKHVLSGRTVVRWIRAERKDSSLISTNKDDIPKIPSA